MQALNNSWQPPASDPPNPTDRVRLIPKHTMAQNNWTQIFSLTGIIVASGVGVFLLQSQRFEGVVEQLQNPTQVELERQVQQEADRLAVMQNLPSFDFDNLVANWAMLNFLYYFGDTDIRNRTGYALAPEYFRIILDQDPYFRTAYFFLSASTSLYAGRPDLAVALMEEKLPLLSPTTPEGSYYVWRYKATDELLFLGRKESARQAYLKAAEWATLDGSEEALQVAATSQETADFLAEDLDSRNAQISAWGSILGNAFDEATQLLAIQNIQALGGTVEQLPNGRYSVRGVPKNPPPTPDAPKPQNSPQTQTTPETPESPTAPTSESNIEQMN